MRNLSFNSNFRDVPFKVNLVMTKYVYLTKNVWIYTFIFLHLVFVTHH